MFGTLFFVLLTLLSVLILMVFLFRAGAARALTVWGLAALLPVLAAMSAANAGQAHATRVLRTTLLAPVSLDIETQGRLYSVNASGLEAACLEHLTRLNAESDWHQAGGIIPIRQDTRVHGVLPTTEIVEALSIRGELNCSDFSSRSNKVHQ